MRTTLSLSVLAVALSGQALAAKHCTDAPRDKWMTEEAFKKQVEASGFVITKFKQPGTCYEIYGTDASGKKVEIYFDPTTGQPTKKK